MRINSSVRSLLFAVIALSLVVLTLPAPSVAQIGIAIRIGPPALPVYEQPVCPGRRLSLDPRLLGVRLRHQRLLLGARDLGAGAGSWLSLDARLVGLGRWRIS